MQYGFLQEHGEEVSHIDSSRAYIEEQAHLQTLSSSSGAKLSRNNLDVCIQGKQAQVALYGAYLNEKNEHSDYYTSIHHHYPQSKSIQFYKGLLNDKSHLVFNGKVVIKSGAKQADSKQINKNILLSNHAVVHSKPELEISEDEVSATHGFTSVALDEQELLYLTSRGISQKEAISIVCRSFLMEVLHLFPCTAIHTLWKKIFNEKFSHIHVLNKNNEKSKSRFN